MIKLPKTNEFDPPQQTEPIDIDPQQLQQSPYKRNWWIFAIAITICLIVVIGGLLGIYYYVESVAIPIPHNITNATCNQVYCYIG